MQPTQTMLALVAMIVALPLAAQAQDNEQEVIDDIVVVGKKSASELRKEVFETEEQFYAIYNKLNDDDDLAVRCFYETPTGTRIQNHVCRAKFVADAYRKHARRNQGDVTRIANQNSDPEFAAKSAQFQEKLESLIATNPDLQAALVRYNSARAEFMATREGDTKNN